MNARHICPITAGAICLLLAPAVSAHPITVDGSAADWSSRKPTVANLGLLTRTAQSTGEFVWLDPKGDTRTDISSPEVVADLVAFHVTGSANGLAFLARRDPAATFSGKPIQIQIAIDVDRVSGSGQTFFAGYGDATVPVANAWEFIVQTRFGSAQSPVVLDTSFAQSGTGTASSGTGADIEIFVPWSALKMTAPPTAPLRFTVATFRSEADDRTTDVIDSANVLDAVTNYGTPSSKTPTPNTWEEVKEGATGVVDYSFDLWFNALGEVYSPLVIQKFVANNAASDEWYAVRNVTGSTLSLAQFKLGDEETLFGTGEGMLDFPAATLAAGQSFVVARDATLYQAVFGTLPDAEVPGTTNTAAPDMVKYAPWMATATNSLNLLATGDELLVVDPSVNIIDLVAYGNSTADVNPYTPAPGVGVVLTRNESSTDTDDCKVDFSNAGAACAGDADCPGQCKQCVAGACVNKPAGASCADNDPCNGAETCDASGACQLGTPKSCNDDEPCTDDFCSPTDGSCSHVNNTAACNDGNACTQNDVCTGGQCKGGSSASCDDGNQCTTDSCDIQTGCQHVPNTGACDDGLFCNGVDTCAAGDCSVHSGDPCGGPDGDDNCSESCDEGADSCTGADPEGSNCNDGKFCTVTDKCAGGVCSGTGDPCPPLDGDENCAESCDEANDSCSGPDPNGSACDDGLFCTKADVCQEGVCSGTGNPCSGPDDDDDCSETCNEQADNCDANDPDGASCANGGKCSGGVCQGSGGAAGAGGSAGASGSSGAAGAAGAGNGGSAGTSGGAGGNAQGGAAGSSEAGAAGAIPDATQDKDEGGCGCSVPGTSSAGSGFLLAALALVSGRIRRRARRV